MLGPDFGEFGASEGAPEAVKRGPLMVPKGLLSYQWSPEHVTGLCERLKGPLSYREAPECVAGPSKCVAGPSEWMKGPS